MSAGGHVQVVDGDSLKQSGGQTEGMVRKNAISDQSDQLCGTVMTAAPHTTSGIHHHGTQDTLIYAARGRGTLVSDNGRTRQDLTPGDFALIPAFTPHQEVNDGDEEVVWVVVRGGRAPVVQGLESWREEARSN